MQSIVELATVCATAQAQARSLGLRLQRRPFDRALHLELDDFLKHDAPQAAAAHQKLLAADPDQLEAEVRQVLIKMRQTG